MPEVIIIGYGNELRGDDGIGPCVARRVAAGGWPGVGFRAVPQLTPELAEDLAGARWAIFIDAGAGGGGEAVAVRRIEAGGPAAALTHFGDPRVLLAMSQALYGRAPEAWLVTVAGVNFAPGEMLSEAARLHVGRAVEQVERLLCEWRR
jgi:hydrogenase maturation protease